jgi:hypothetical protein
LFANVELFENVEFYRKAVAIPAWNEARIYVGACGGKNLRFKPTGRVFFEVFEID